MIMPSNIARLMVPIKNVKVHKDKRPRFWPGADVKWREGALWRGWRAGEEAENLCF